MEGSKKLAGQLPFPALRGSEVESLQLLRQNNMSVLVGIVAISCRVEDRVGIFWFASSVCIIEEWREKTKQW